MTFVQIPNTPDAVTLAELRQKAASGDLTLDEMKAVIADMRQGRALAEVYSATAAKAKKPKPPKAVTPAISGADLLAELENL